MAERDRAGAAERDSLRPGVTGGGQSVVPGTASSAAQGADRAEGTGGAVGEMDFTGAPAGSQSIEATTAALGDMEPSAGSGGASRAETDNETDV